MANLLGESFPKEIIKQVKKRQEVYGSLNRSNEEIRYMNGNSAWIRLASSIKISSQIADKDGNLSTSLFAKYGTGDDVAKKYVLFGGTSFYSSKVTNDTTGDTKTSFGGFYSGLEGYQLGGDSQGYRPQPGITSFSTKNRNRGSIRESDIVIKCYNKEQFEIIDILYLRLGYSVFVEWGHSIYVDNNGKVKNMQETDTLTYKFLNGDYDNQGSLAINSALQNQRIKLQGNYDGFFGTISNFSWTYENDGSYTINLKLISKGDIIESLKINPLPLTWKAQTSEEAKETEENLQNANLDQDYLSYAKNKNQMASDFWVARQKLDKSTQSGVDWGTVALVGGAVIAGTALTIFTFGAGAPAAVALVGAATAGVVTSTVAATVIVGGTIAVTTAGYAASQVYYGKFTDSEHVTISKWAKTDFNCTYEEDIVKLNEINGSFEFNEQLYYIRLGGFIDYLNSKYLLYTGDKASPKFANFYIDPDENSNLIFTTENVLSSNPKVCVVKTNISTSTDSFNIFGDDTTGLPATFRKEIEGVTVGMLYNVYINMVYILKSIEETKDEEGNANLFDLLKKIADGINQSLGGINKIQPVIDEAQGRIYFVDETAIPNREKIFEKAFPELNIEPAKFNVFGYKDNDASFVTNLGIKTEITNELASMITIGAQAKGTAVGIDATAFSKWNEGLGDRVILKKFDSSESNEQTQEQQEQNYENIENEYNNFVRQMAEYNWSEDLGSFPEILTNYLNYKQATKSIVEKKASTTLGFIPISLNLDFIGLSGIKIYNTYSVNSEFLPINYGETLDFIVKGITHKIEGSKWITSIESSSIPKSSVTTEANNNKVKGSPAPQTVQGGTTSSSNGSPSTPSTTATTQANQVTEKWGKGCLPNPVDNEASYTLQPVPKEEIEKRTQALEAAWISTFKNGQDHGKCGRYTYSHAYNFIQNLKGLPMANGTTGSGNDANSAKYRANLINLGYQQSLIFESVPKSKVQKFLRNTNNFNPGDIAIYYSNDDVNDGNEPPRHTQMYVGNQKKYGVVNNKRGYTTDNWTNYGPDQPGAKGDGIFIYNSRKNTCWTLFIMQAPKDFRPAGFNDSRALYEKYAKTLKKILELKDTNSNDVYPGQPSNTPLLKVFKGTLDDDQSGAILRLKSLFGYQKTEVTIDGVKRPSAWYNKQPYSALIPEHQELFKKEFDKLMREIDKNNNTYDFKLLDSQDPKKYSDLFITVTPDF